MTEPRASPTTKLLPTCRFHTCYIWRVGRRSLSVHLLQAGHREITVEMDGLPTKEIENFNHENDELVWFSWMKIG